MYLDHQKLTRYVDAYLNTTAGTVQSLAAAVGVHQSTLFRLRDRHHTSNPSLSTLNALAKALGCTAHDLVS